MRLEYRTLHASDVYYFSIGGFLYVSGLHEFHEICCKGCIGEAFVYLCYKERAGKMTSLLFAVHALVVPLVFVSDFYCMTPWCPFVRRTLRVWQLMWYFVLVKSTIYTQPFFFWQFLKRWSVCTTWCLFLTFLNAVTRWDTTWSWVAVYYPYYT